MCTSVDSEELRNAWISRNQSDSSTQGFLNPRNGKDKQGASALPLNISAQVYRNPRDVPRPIPTRDTVAIWVGLLPIKWCAVVNHWTRQWTYYSSEACLGPIHRLGGGGGDGRLAWSGSCPNQKAYRCSRHSAPPPSMPPPKQLDDVRRGNCARRKILFHFAKRFPLIKAESACQECDGDLIPSAARCGWSPPTFRWLCSVSSSVALVIHDLSFVELPAVVRALQCHEERDRANNLRRF